MNRLFNCVKYIFKDVIYSIDYKETFYVLLSLILSFFPIIIIDYLFGDRGIAFLFAFLFILIIISGIFGLVSCLIKYLKKAWKMVK